MSYVRVELPHSLVGTTSGDQVNFDLQEPGKHTGMFHGAIPTASAGNPTSGSGRAASGAPAGARVAHTVRESATTIHTLVSA